MTYEQMNGIIDSALEELMPSLGPLANVPIRTGRLRSAIKLKRTQSGWTIYLDTGGIDEDDWNTMFPSGAKLNDSPQGIAPYGPSVDEYSHFWIRVFDTVAQKIKSALGGAVENYSANYQNRGD